MSFFCLTFYIRCIKVNNYTSLNQYKLLYISKKFNLNRIPFIQDRLISDFVFRLVSVNDALKFFKDISVNDLGFFFTSTDKLRLTIALRYLCFIPEFNNIYLNKISGASLFFKFTGLYNLSLQSLLNSVSLPILEKYSDRFSLTNRPFRDSYESFKHIHYLYSNSTKHPIWCIEIKTRLFFTNLSKLWLLKNFPIKQNFLMYLLFTETFRNFLFSEDNFFSSNNIYVNFFNYILNGLV